MANGAGELTGIVGVGRMGLAIARHLMKHGYRVLAQDIDGKAMEAARAAGARTAATPAEVGKEARFVIVAVGYDDEAAASLRFSSAPCRSSRPTRPTSFTWATWAPASSARRSTISCSG